MSFRSRFQDWLDRMRAPSGTAGERRWRWQYVFALSAFIAVIALAVWGLPRVRSWMNERALQSEKSAVTHAEPLAPVMRPAVPEPAPAEPTPMFRSRRPPVAPERDTIEVGSGSDTIRIQKHLGFGWEPAGSDSVEYKVHTNLGTFSCKGRACSGLKEKPVWMSFEALPAAATFEMAYWASLPVSRRARR